MEVFQGNYGRGRKRPRLPNIGKPLLQRATGTRKGNLVAIKNKTAKVFPIQSNAANNTKFTFGTLVNNVGPKETKVRVINENGREYLVPVKNLNFLSRNLMKHHDVEIKTSLPDLPQYRGILAEDFNGKTFRYMAPTESEKREEVNAGKVVSFLNRDILNQKKRKLENKNRLVEDAEVHFVNRISEKQARKLFNKVFKNYLSLEHNLGIETRYIKEMNNIQKKNRLNHKAASILEWVTPEQWRLNYVRGEEVDALMKNVYHTREHFLKILNKLIYRFPELAQLIPANYIADKLKFLHNARIQQYPQTRYHGGQIKKQMARPTDTSSRKKINKSGSSAKPEYEGKSRRVSKLPINASHNLELHHIVTGKVGNMSKNPEIGSLIKINGPTYWHSNETWNWPGKGNQRPLVRIVGMFNKDNKKLEYTGRHEKEINGKKKGTFHHKGPLNLYIYDITRNKTKPVYMVRQLPRKNSSLSHKSDNT